MDYCLPSLPSLLFLRETNLGFLTVFRAFQQKSMLLLLQKYSESYLTRGKSYMRWGTWIKSCVQLYKTLGIKIYFIVFDFTQGLSSGLKLVTEVTNFDVHDYMKVIWFNDGKYGSKVLNFTWLHLLWIMIH